MYSKALQIFFCTWYLTQKWMYLNVGIYNDPVKNTFPPWYQRPLRLREMYQCTDHATSYLFWTKIPPSFFAVQTNCRDAGFVRFLPHNLAGKQAAFFMLKQGSCHLVWMAKNEEGRFFLKEVACGVVVHWYISRSLSGCWYQGDKTCCWEVNYGFSCLIRFHFL